jgi:hypothetical protein
MQGAMDRMWDINQHNASQAGRGGGGGQAFGGGQMSGGRPSSIAGMAPDSYAPLRQAKMDADAQSIRSRGAANDFIWKARQPEFQGPLQAMFGFGGWGMNGQSPFGSLPTQFNTNYGAFGNVTNPR